MAVLDVVRQPSLVAVTGKLHGLGNRVRVVLGARSLARVEDRVLFYTWHTGSAFGARFDELWEVSDAVIPRPAARALALRYPFRDNTLAWLDDAVRAARVIQIRTPHALRLPPKATPWEEELQALRPVDAVRARVEGFFGAQLRGDPYVGVMVRAHSKSHPVTLRESPVSWYLERMGEIRDIHPDMRFFVSSDTAEAQAKVLKAFPRAVALADKGAYNSREALQASVADLYLLASSTHVLAPHYSSFPEMAQKLAGRSLKLETSQTELETRFDGAAQLTVVNDPIRPHLRRLL